MHSLWIPNSDVPYVLIDEDIENAVSYMASNKAIGVDGLPDVQLKQAIK